MFKMEAAASDDGNTPGAIFMQPDGLFEGRIYRKQAHGKVVEQEFGQQGEFEICAVAGTLIQARTLLHEELDWNGNGCHYCKFP